MLRRTLLPLLFWLAAAAVASMCGPLATIVTIFVAACCYTRFCARNAGASHALGVGVAWLTLSIVTEIVTPTHALLGSPDHPLLRNLTLFAWIFAPACFARREEAGYAR